MFRLYYLSVLVSIVFLYYFQSLVGFFYCDRDCAQVWEQSHLFANFNQIGITVISKESDKNDI